LIGVILGVIIFIFVHLFGKTWFFRKTEKIGIVGKYHLDNLPIGITTLIANGLAKINSDGSVEPDLAKSWETADNGKTWIFTLKDHLRWQDGKRLTSLDINYQFSDAEIEKPDENTIIFKLQSPFAPFPAVVSKPIFKKGLLGTGEWKVDKASTLGGFVQKIVLINGQGNKKIFKFYPTEERAKLGFKLGEIDILAEIFNPTPFTSWKTVDVEANIQKRRIVAIFLNTQDKLLAEKSFRQALAYGINKEKFEGPRAISCISPDSWAYNPQVKPYNYDENKAKKLLSELPDELKENPTLVLDTTSVLLPIAEAVVKDWQAIGINASIKVNSAIPADYRALLVIVEIPQDPDQYSLWHSTQIASNISKYSNPRIDKLLEEGRSQLNIEERRKIYLDFQRFLLEDSPAIFLYHPPLYTIRRK